MGKSQAYENQCALFNAMSEVEKKAYSKGYEWAWKCGQDFNARVIKDWQDSEIANQSKIEQLETKNKALVHALVNTNAEKTKLAHDYWNQAERLAEYCSMLMSSESELTVSCFQKEKKIEQLGKKLNAVNNLLNDLKTERKDFKEFDLYDKGHRVAVDYIIQDLEKTLRGECE